VENRGNIPRIKVINWNTSLSAAQLQGSGDFPLDAHDYFFLFGKNESPFW